MRVMQLHETSTGLTLLPAEAPRPKPAPGQFLIRVHAAGVTTTELNWYPSTHRKSGEQRTAAIPGHEFSGVIAEIAGDAGDFAVGQEVYGMNDWFEEGATAEYCLAPPSSLAVKPSSLTHEEAATVPIGALTALQGLFERANLQPGETVLVHGGSGAVGMFAVQLAHRHGVRVIATTSAETLSFVKDLGAVQVIDYKADRRFEEVIQPVDVVFDTVGGHIRERSRTVLRPGGRLISIAADGEVTTDPVVRDAYFIVEPRRSQLVEIARLIDSGAVRTFVNAVVPLSQAAAAYAGTVPKRGFGKIVISIESGQPSIG